MNILRHRKRRRTETKARFKKYFSLREIFKKNKLECLQTFTMKDCSVLNIVEFQREKMSENVKKQLKVVHRADRGRIRHTTITRKEKEGVALGWKLYISLYISFYFTKEY